MANSRIPRLPLLLDRKIYKTGQTRGADDDVIYQNRVSRSSTVLIPYGIWTQFIDLFLNHNFQNGFIVLLTPQEYFENSFITEELHQKRLQLGHNALIFYQLRSDWINYNPELKGLIPANNRISPLGGQYVARISATTASDNGSKISKGFNTTGMKGAGIRLYEYAPDNVIADCRTQLESLFWLCYDSIDAVTSFGMTKEDAILRRELSLQTALNKGLLDFAQLYQSRLINENNHAICPLCLEVLSGYGFFNKVLQAEGREVHDLTVTEVNLFHIQELRYGQFNHRPYNLGWGHHHCNVVVKDSGINETLIWMNDIIKRNINQKLFPFD